MRPPAADAPPPPPSSPAPVQYGKTPLMTAARDGHTELVRFLLDFKGGVPPSSANKEATNKVRPAAFASPAHTH